MSRIILYLIFMWSCCSCAEDSRNILYPDPMAELFWGKQVRMMLAYHEGFPSLIDSTRFDSLGNMIEIRKFWHKERRSFDTLHFLTRQLIRSEEIKNYSIVYEAKSKMILQNWRALKDFKWEYSENDINSEDSFVVKMLISDGLLIKEIDETRGIYSSYFYNQNRRLVKKENRSIEGDVLSEEWEYEYSTRFEKCAIIFLKVLSRHITVHQTRELILP
jgi:hypothetical protein